MQYCLQGLKATVLLVFQWNFEFPGYLIISVSMHSNSFTYCSSKVSIIFPCSSMFLSSLGMVKSLYLWLFLFKSEIISDLISSTASCSCFYFSYYHSRNFRWLPVLHWYHLDLNHFCISQNVLRVILQFENLNETVLRACSLTLTY